MNFTRASGCIFAEHNARSGWKSQATLLERFLARKKKEIPTMIVKFVDKNGLRTIERRYDYAKPRRHLQPAHRDRYRPEGVPK
jgi:hypothetical protein